MAHSGRCGKALLPAAWSSPNGVMVAPFHVKHLYLPALPPLGARE
jgi:hypothetical protein